MKTLNNKKLLLIIGASLGVVLSPVNAEPDAATAQREAAARAEAIELENLNKQNAITESLKRRSDQDVKAKRKEMARKRAEASKAVLAAQKAHQQLEKRKSEYDEKVGKYQEKKQAREEERVKRQQQMELMARKEEEQKAAVTSILSNLFDARKLRDDIGKTTDLEALQTKLREAQTLRTQAEDRNAKIVSMYSERIPQADDAVKEIDSVVAAIRDKISSSTVQTATVKQ